MKSCLTVQVYEYVALWLVTFERPRRSIAAEKTKVLLEPLARACLPMLEDSVRRLLEQPDLQNGSASRRTASASCARCSTRKAR